MKKLFFSALFASSLTGLTSESANADELLFPPGATKMSGVCFTTLSNGSIRGSVGGQNCSCMTTWCGAIIGVPYVTGPAGGVAQYWTSTAPSGTSVRGRGRSYSTSGSLFSTSVWVNGGGDKMVDTIKGLGPVVFEYQFQTTGSAVPTLHSLAQNQVGD